MQNRASSENDSLLLIRAAAGSGKTHRLTGEFLRLLFSAENRYKNVLAVTFTNKATDEMKTRIIDELFRLSGEEKSDYLKDLMQHFNMPEDAIRQKAKEILEQILHDYSSFSISTIDKFFQQTMRAFTREMGLSGGYKIELDTTAVLTQIVDLMISELDRPENKELAGWILDFMKNQIQESKSWNVRPNIVKLSRQLFNEKYKLLPKESRDSIDDKEKLKSYRKMLIKIVSAWELEVKQTAEKALKLIHNFGLTVSDFKHGRNSGFLVFEKLANGVFVEPSARFFTRPDNLEDWATKTSSKKYEIEQAYIAGLNDCVKKIIEMFNNNSHYNSARSILHNFYTLGILSDVKKRLQQFQKENNILFLSDTTELLNKIIADSNSPFVYEKTGTRIHHYMIDEFQDTSSLQWMNFKPLVDESLANGNFNLVVGDVKQSIYRWRNSDWGLLESQISQDFRNHPLTEDVLDTNWRSDGNIVRFNNQFFKTASTLLQGNFNLECGDETDENQRIVNAYKHVHQLLSPYKKDNEGHVKISFLDDSANENDWRTQALNQLPIELENLQKQGFALKDIVILVRKNSEAVEIAEFLLEYKKANPNSVYRYDIISNEALIIGNAQSVKAAVALLRYFQNRNDETCRLMAVYEYFRFMGNLSAEEALTLFFNEEIRDFPKKLRRELEDISALPFYEMVETFFSMNNHLIAQSEYVYVQAFMDIMLKFSTEASANTNDFLAWWDETGNQKTLFTPENQDALRLMTIHKSKGLGFKVVIMPFLKWSIDHRYYNAPILWCEPAVEPFNFLGAVPLIYQKALEKTIFKNEYFEEKLYTYIDNLNLIYVGFTRAKNRIIGFAPKPKKEAMGDISDLLWNTLQLDSGDEKNQALKEYIVNSDEDVIFELGSADKVGEKKEKSGQETMLSGQWKSIPFDDRLSLRLNSEGFFSSEGNRAFGKLMHEIISNIETVNDIEDAVEQRYISGELTNEEKHEITVLLKTILSRSDVKEWYSGKYQVMNETQVLLPSSSFSRPDRVMIHNDEVIVVDYKFGDLEETKYKRQVERYVQNIRKMGFSNVKGYLFYVSKNVKYEIQ